THCDVPNLCNTPSLCNIRRWNNIRRPSNPRRRQNLCQLMFVRVADDLAHARHSGDFIRSALSITSGDHDLTLGVLTMNTADGGARVLIGSGGHGASVEHNNLRLRWRAGPVEPALTKLAFNGSAVGLSGPAAK